MLLDKQAHDGVPLVAVEVSAGRVVAAAVQQDSVARLGGLKRVDHRLEVDPAGVAVVIGIKDGGMARARDHRFVIGPGGCAYEDPAARVQGGDELEGEAERTTAAGRLEARHLRG